MCLCGCKTATIARLVNTSTETFVASYRCSNCGTVMQTYAGFHGTLKPMTTTKS